MHFVPNIRHKAGIDFVGKDKRSYTNMHEAYIMKTAIFNSFKE